MGCEVSHKKWRRPASSTSRAIWRADLRRCRQHLGERYGYDSTAPNVLAERQLRRSDRRIGQRERARWRRALHFCLSSSRVEFPKGLAGVTISVSLNCSRLKQRTRLAAISVLSNSAQAGDWSGKRDSNPRPRPWQGRALPTELFPHYRHLTHGESGRIADPSGPVNRPAGTHRGCARTANRCPPETLRRRRSGKACPPSRTWRGRATPCGRGGRASSA